jgi:hypothetical protein
VLYSDDARLGARPDAPPWRLLCHSLAVSDCDSSVLCVRPVCDVYDLDVAEVVASSPKVRLLLPLLLLRLDLGNVLDAVADVRSVTMHGQVWSGGLQEPRGATLRACCENNGLRYRTTRIQAHQMIMRIGTSLTSDGHVFVAARLLVSVHVSLRSERRARGLALRDGARGGGVVAVGARVVGRVRRAGRARGVVSAVLRRPGPQRGAMARVAFAIHHRLHT